MTRPTIHERLDTIEAFLHGDMIEAVPYRFEAPYQQVWVAEPFEQLTGARWFVTYSHDTDGHYMRIEFQAFGNVLWWRNIRVGKATMEQQS